MNNTKSSPNVIVSNLDAYNQIYMLFFIFIALIANHPCWEEYPFLKIASILISFSIVSILWLVSNFSDFYNTIKPIIKNQGLAIPNKSTSGIQEIVPNANSSFNPNIEIIKKDFGIEDKNIELFLSISNLILAESLGLQSGHKNNKKYNSNKGSAVLLVDVLKKLEMGKIITKLPTSPKAIYRHFEGVCGSYYSLWNALNDKGARNSKYQEASERIVNRIIELKKNS